MDGLGMNDGLRSRRAYDLEPDTPAASPRYTPTRGLGAATRAAYGVSGLLGQSLEILKAAGDQGVGLGMVVAPDQPFHHG